MPHLKVQHSESGSNQVRAMKSTDEHGIAHLLEHMAFKEPRRSAREIAEQIEDVGGEVNAATSTETTSYYARVLKDHVPLAVDILADILTESAFEEEELEREKQVILQEINAANDTPDDVVFDRFSSRSSRPDSRPRHSRHAADGGLVHPAADLRLSSAATTRPTACSWSRLALQHDEFVRMVEDRFSSLPTAPSATPVMDPAKYIGGNIRVKPATYAGRPDPARL